MELLVQAAGSRYFNHCLDLRAGIGDVHCRAWGGCHHYLTARMLPNLNIPLPPHSFRFPHVCLTASLTSIYGTIPKPPHFLAHHCPYTLHVLTCLFITLCVNIAIIS